MKIAMYKKVIPVLKPIAIASFVLIVFVGGVIVGAKHIGARSLPASVSASLFATEPKNVDLTPVWKVWHILNERFVDAYYEENATSTPKSEEEKNQDKVWGMAEGLAASMGDPYTVFLPPSDAEMFNDDISGSFEGVGMEIAIRDGLLTVVSPLRGTPAFKAGIKAKDRILKIDGVSTKGMNITDAVKKIRGKKGSEVTFDIFREGESDLLKIKVIRSKIDIPTIKTKQLKNGIFVIELLHFSATSPDLFRKALQKFIDSKSDKLILDLRGNPGGYLEAAVDIASWFLPQGDMVVTEDYGPGGKQIEHRSKGRNIFTNKLKMVILVDKGSASASEILAGALREHKRAKLIGTNTFGKGSVQELVNITDKASLKVTVARWLLPGGIHINRDGIEPDIRVNLKDLIKDGKLKEGDDPIMDRAVRYLTTGK